MAMEVEERTKVAIERLLAQQKLDGTSGLEVRLSNQNQVYLNTWRPTRAAIPASLLEKLVPGFRAGSPAFLTIIKLETGEMSYHWYSGGPTWIPIISKNLGRPDDVFHVAIEPLTCAGFLDRFPSLMLSNESYLVRWMPDDVLLRFYRDGLNFNIVGEQWPPINGLNDFTIPCTTTGEFLHQTGSTILPFTIEDAFSVKRRMRLYHNGHKAKLSVICAVDSFKVVNISYDGFRTRFVYEYSVGELASTTVYLKRPSVLYRLGELVEIPNRFHFNGIHRLYFIDSVEILKEYEREMVEHGRHYQTGRIGAEIAYSIVTEKFGCPNLVLEEPGRGGSDLYSTDFRVVAEARMTRRLPWKMEPLIEKEIRQMSGKLQADFRYTSQARIGYAVLSLYQFGKTGSLIAEVLPR
jgi:hypothetical protein